METRRGGHVLVAELIGRHTRSLESSDPGLEVIREGRGIVKKALCKRDLVGIHNEATMLRELSGTGFAPELLEEGEDYIIEEDLGSSQPVTNKQAFLHNAALLLFTLWRHGIQHGDLTSSNVIVKENKPIAIDFLESHFSYEGIAAKRKLSDRHYLWQFVAAILGVEVGDVTPREVVG